MAKIDYSQAIRSLEFSYGLLPKKPEVLSKSDLKTLGEACSLYLKFYESFVGASTDPRIEDALTFQKFVIDTEIENLVNKFREAEEEEKEKKQKPKEQEASIPPELEALVAEYRQNQALLESEDVKNNSQKSVALQVKIAIAHSKIKALALANKQRLIATGKKFESYDTILVSLGSPKSESVTAALATSYKAVQEVAFTHENFNKLSPQVQNEIITQAVELNTACVTNIDVAIQSAALLIDSSVLSPADQKNVSNISSNFVHSVYDAVNSQTQQAATFENQITENEVVVLKLTDESKPLKGEALETIQFQIKTLADTNQQLTKKLDNLPHQLDVFVNNQLPDYQKFENDNQNRFKIALEKDLALIDLPDRIKLANKKISELHNNLERNGVKPHIYTPMDDAKLLEDAIRHDIPGVLRSYSGYEAEYAAALVNHPKTQDPDLSPLAILLFGKELTPVVFTKILQFASTKENAGTALGKLFQTRKDIFEATGTQISKISQSPLGKEILKTTGGLGKVFKSTSRFFGKISDNLGKVGTVFRAISNPYQALKSWAGRKVGRYVVNKLINSTAGKVAIAATRKLAGELLKKGIGKAIVNIATKLGIKIAAWLGLSATVAGAPVALVLAIVDVVWTALTIGLKIVKNIVQNTAQSLYGEKVKARDLIAIPVAGAATVVGGIITFFGALGTATVAAAGSAVAITVVGIFIGIFFYITSIAVAPLLSTLVNLQSSPGLGKATGCANIEGTFVSQRDPAWANVLCPSCISGDNCKIGTSGCGSAATTMILKSFGINEDVVNIWNIMHDAGGYAYSGTHPYTSCPSYDTANIKVLTDNSLTVTDIGYSLDEADKTLESCDLVFALGMLYTDCPDQVAGCGHYLVITGHNGNQITTNDPWSGEQYIHNIDGPSQDAFIISQMWSVVSKK